MSYDAGDYWDRRARRYGGMGEGHKAVCYVGDADWANAYVHSLQTKAVFSVLRVEPGMKLLDAGCGVGRWSLKFAELSASVSAFDISQEMIRIAARRAAQRGLSISFFVQAIEELDPDLENSFDVVCIAVLQHITDPDMFQVACHNLVKAARPGGKILVLEYAGHRRLRGGERSDHMAFRDRDTLVKVFERKGATLSSERGVRFMKLEECWRQLAGDFARRFLGYNDAASNVEILERASRGSITARIETLGFNLVRRFLFIVQWPADCFLSSLLTSRSYERVMIFEKRASNTRVQ